MDGFRIWFPENRKKKKKWFVRWVEKASRRRWKKACRRASLIIQPRWMWMRVGACSASKEEKTGYALPASSTCHIQSKTPQSAYESQDSENIFRTRESLGEKYHQISSSSNMTRPVWIRYMRCPFHIGECTPAENELYYLDPSSGILFLLLF